MHADAHDLGADDFRHVALGRPQAARGNDHIGPLQGLAQNGLHAYGIVPHRRFI